MYASRSDVEAAIERMRVLSGFREHPDCFVIGEYVLGEDHWRDGYVTWRQDKEH